MSAHTSAQACPKARSGCRWNTRITASVSRRPTSAARASAIAGPSDPESAGVRARIQLDIPEPPFDRDRLQRRGRSTSRRLLRHPSRNDVQSERFPRQRAFRLRAGCSGYRRIDSGPPGFLRPKRVFAVLADILRHRTYFENGSMLNAGVAYTCENNYNFFYPDREELVRMATVPVHSQIILSPRYALQCTAEYQYFKETLYSRDWFSNGSSPRSFTGASLNFSVVAELLGATRRIPRKKLGVRIGELAFPLAAVYRDRLWRSRGGMSCTNGICRFVQRSRDSAHRDEQFLAEVHHHMRGEPI